MCPLVEQGTKSIQHFFTSHASAPQHAECPARQNVNIPPPAAVSPSKKTAEKPKGILKYLGSNIPLAITAHDDQELADTNIAPPAAASPSKKADERARGILKYLGSTSARPTIENEALLNDDDVRPLDTSVEVDGGVDLETVDVDEQRHILEGIYRSRHGQSTGSSLQNAKRGRKPGQRVGSSKRAREQPSVSQPKQPGIGTYFQARDKP